MTAQKRRRREGAPTNGGSVNGDTYPIDSEAIARRAFELYQRRGSEDGRDWEDWFQAEDEVRAQSRQV